MNLFLIHLCDSLVSIDTKAHSSSRQVSCPLVWFEHCGYVGSQKPEGKRRGEGGGEEGNGGFLSQVKELETELRTG